MRLTIVNVGPIQRAEIEIGNITMVCGPNESGKSTIARVLQAMLAGGGVPPGLRKNQAGAFVRQDPDGSHGTGYASLETAAGKAECRWPAAEIIVTGEPFPWKTEGQPSQVALGMVNPFTLTAVDRASLFARYLKSEPTDTAVREALSEMGLAPERIDVFVDKLREVGWDGLHKQAVEHGQKLKGAWEQITGAPFGPDKAKGWEPQGLKHGKTQAILEGDLIAARAALSAAEGSAAADWAEIERSKERIANLKNDRAALKTGERTLKTVEDEIAAAEARLKSIGDTKIRAFLEASCPECGVIVGIVDDPATTHRKTLVKLADLPADAELAERRKKADDIDKEIAKARGRRVAPTNKISAAKTAIATAETYERRLDELKEKLGSIDGPPTSVAVVNLVDLKASVALADVAIAALLKLEAAKTKTAAIARNQDLIDFLSPRGARTATMKDAVDHFNATALAPLCEAAGWKRLVIDPEDLMPSWDVIAYMLASTGARHRMHVLIQAAFAQIDKSGLVILDGADVLDTESGRSGLLSICQELGVSCLIGMTCARKAAERTSLATAGIGHSYWLEDGGATEI